MQSTAADGVMEAPPRGALELHEGVCPEDRAAGCSRWPAKLWLLSSAGQLVRGRCHATNLCAYCARLAAVENSELLWLDALHGEAPGYWLVLTTPSADPRPSVFYLARRKLMEAMRREWPAAQYAALVEFTTGYGPRAGGQRRPHWNLFVKGVPGDQEDALQALVASEWCPRVGGKIAAQHVAPVGEMARLIRYVALHFQKEEQAPPRGWRGIRFTKSRGYLWTSTAAAREAARRSLRFKREVWRLERLDLNLDAHELENYAHQAMAESDALLWQLVQLRPDVVGEEREQLVQEWAEALWGDGPRESLKRALSTRPGSEPDAVLSALSEGTEAP